MTDRPPVDPSTATLPVIEEQLEVGRRVVDTGPTLRLHKQVEQAPVRIEQSLVRDLVEVRRVPVDRVVAEPPPVRHDGDTMVLPVLQERLVTRRELVLVEEVHLVRRREDVPFAAEVVLQRERVVVERLDPSTGHWHADTQG